MVRPVQAYGFNASEVINYLRLVNASLDHPNAAADIRCLVAPQLRYAGQTQRGRNTANASSAFKKDKYRPCRQVQALHD